MFKIIASCFVALCTAFYPADKLAVPEAAPTAQTYRIEVDITNQITTVYHNADQTVARQMICSTGRGNSTPLGTLKLEQSRESDRSEWYYIGKYKCYVKYPTRIQGPILFHSLPYLGMEMSRLDRQAVEELGTRASHGCVRLRWEDAKWIADHCPDGTTVKLFVGAAKKVALHNALLREGYDDQSGIPYDEFLKAACGDAVCGTLSLGASGVEVAALQENLAALGLLDVEASGVYDDATAAAVARFQRWIHFVPNGIANAGMREEIKTAAQRAAG